MSSDPPINLYPIMVVEDRYQGVYSGGCWWAVACADELLENKMRGQWLMENGPGSDDVTCGVFWSRPPPWIAAGQSPDDAVASLVAKAHGTDESKPPAWADDPALLNYFLELAD
ncbi:hypothetical protein [Sphingomonas sp.]|jgi:hypothetical protein|uniref:hypothetical protein n=1 Tax=Sphingomonas sp. TaxID=28214 RepID=UPI002ED813F8